MRVLYLGVVLCFIAVCSANSCGSSELNLFGTPNDELPFNPSALGHHWRRTNPEASNLLPPLILIPGLTGSGLQSKLTNAKLPILCNRNQDWARIWIEPLRLARVDCFTHTLMLSYDPATKTYSNTQGVSIDAIDFGGIEGVNYLAYNGDNQPVNQTDYFQPLISYLTGAGFIVGETLYAAPYDWRLTTNPNGWNDKFKTLVETAYTNSGNKKVFTLCHSMGNLEFASFMQTMTTEWKEKYIGGFISAAAPWSGASVALRALISGFEFKVGPITIDPLVIANVARTFGSVVWMLPDQYLRGTDPIVTVNSTTYNYLQFNSIFNQLGATETREIYTDMLGTLAFLPAPGVPTYCLYGTNKPTELWYEYNNGLNNQPTAIHCDPSGDGVVPLASLQKCLNMNPVSSRTFNLVSHGDLVKDPLFFNEVMRIVSPIPAK